MTQTRVLSLLVLVMCVLNIGLLALLWQGRSVEPSPGPVAADLARELHFTPRQQEQFRTLREAHHARMQALLRELTARREQLFAGLAQPATAAATPVLLSQIGAIQRQTDSLTFAHFAAVGRLLAPDQLPRWQQLVPGLPRRLQQQRPFGHGPDERGRPDGPPPEEPLRPE